MLGELFASWMRVLTQPDQETFLAEKEKISAYRLLIALVLAGLVAGLVKVPIQGEGIPLLLNIGTVTLTTIAEFIILALVLFIIARAVGGRGSFLAHSYLLSLPIVPIFILAALFGRLAVAAPILEPLAPLGLERVLTIILIIYGFFLSLLALQAAHQMASASQAIYVALITLALWLVLDVVAMFVAGADNVITRTARFMGTHTDQLLEQALWHAWLVIFSMSIAIVLGVIIGILISLPPRRPRLSHLLLLIPLAIFLAVYLGGSGTFGPSMENTLEDILSRPKGFGLVGTVLILALYILFIFGERIAEPVLYAAGIMLTFPSIGLFGLFIPLFGIGFVNAAVALVLYAQLPILRNTYTGIKEVPRAIIEAGRGMGMTEWQILRKVQMPMTVPVIMAGVRISMVMIVGIAAIAKLIGVTCLGKYIFDGLGQGSTVKVISGAIGVSIFALLVDGLLGWLQRVFTPLGLRERR
jgi:osmoprotectant transport system permease protein